MPTEFSLSRRRFIAVAMGASMLPAGLAMGTPVATTDFVTGPRPAPSNIGSGIEITDFRIIPEFQPAHFIIEIHSTRNDAIDSPTVGMIIPDAPIELGYSWARPWDPVLQPGTSTFGVGVLPSIEFYQEDINWVICGSESENNIASELIADWDWALEYNTEILDADSLQVIIEIGNTGLVPFAGGELRGIVRDRENRICGGIPLTNMYNLQPGATVPRSMTLRKSWSSISNPFPLAGSAQNMEITVHVQPRRPPASRSCPAVLPWNR